MRCIESIDLYIEPRQHLHHCGQIKEQKRGWAIWLIITPEALKLFVKKTLVHLLLYFAYIIINNLSTVC